MWSVTSGCVFTHRMTCGLKKNEINEIREFRDLENTGVVLSFLRGIQKISSNQVWTACLALSEVQQIHKQYMELTNELTTVSLSKHVQFTKALLSLCACQVWKPHSCVQTKTCAHRPYMAARAIAGDAAHECWEDGRTCCSSGHRLQHN